MESLTGGGLVKPSHTTREGLRWQIFWIATIGGLGVFDAWRASKRDGSTFSECTRRTFNTDDPRGSALFTRALEVGSAALLAHILREQAQ